MVVREQMDGHTETYFALARCGSEQIRIHVRVTD